MKVAVGIIGITLAMIAFLQSCTVGGLSNIAGEEAVAGAAALGGLTAFFMFLGGAFSFGLPGVARVLFALAFLVSIPARKDFPDMWVWGIVSALLGCLLWFTRTKKSKETET